MIGIKEIIDQEPSIYAIAKKISIATGEPLKTVHARISSWAEKEPRQWTDLQVFLHTLGYTIKVKRLPK